MRLFAATLALSVAVHLAVMALVPRFANVNTRELSTRPLDVALVRSPDVPPIPRPIAPPSSQQRPPEPRSVTRTKPLKESVEQAAPAKESRTLALSVPSVSPVFTVAPSVEPESRELKPELAAAPPVAPPTAALKEAAPAVKESTAIVPPSFNAAYLHNPAPRYPIVARRSGVAGTVRLKVLVTAEGRAAQVNVEQSSGSSMLDSAALDAVRNWRFVPARREQKPVEADVIVPIVFKLEDAR